MHTLATTPRRTARGFSMVEAVVSATLFAVVAALLTWSMTAAFGARTQALTTTQAATALGSELDALASLGPAQLVSGAYTVPSPCAGTPTGITGRSCAPAGSLTLTIAYRFIDPSTPGTCPGQSADPTAVLSAHGQVQLQGCVVSTTSAVLSGASTGTAGIVPAQTRTIQPAEPGQVSNGRAVDVHLDGDVAALSGRTLYLLTPDGTPVASAPFNGSAADLTLSVPAVATQAVCTPALVCHLGLSTGAGDTSTDPTVPGIALTDPAGASGIVVADNRTVHADVNLVAQ